MSAITRDEYRADYLFAEYPRDEDAILDDINNLIRLKQDLLSVLESASEHISREAADEHYIAVEQSFDDMLHKALDSLEDELGYAVAYPQSARLQSWNRKSKGEA